MSVSHPFFSIITVNLNHAAGLEKTLESLAAQTCENGESIMVDGGRADGRVNVIPTYSPKIQYRLKQVEAWVQKAEERSLFINMLMVMKWAVVKWSRRGRP